MSTATADERYFASLVNTARADRGLPQLRLERTLNDSADAHTAWMLDSDVFSHTGSGGSSSNDRMVAAGFGLKGEWLTAENLAYVGIDRNGSLRDEVAFLHSRLMESPSHLENIVDPRAELIGVGLKVGTFTYESQDYRVLMATQNFGRTEAAIDADIPLPPSWQDELLGLTRAEWRDGFDGVSTRDAGAGGVTRGSAENDDLRLRAGADVVQARAGDDWVAGGGGNDLLRGQRGEDRMLGQGGNDRLFGGAGTDGMKGGGGADLLNGQGGGDRMLGQAGADELNGGGGHDILVGGRGADILTGGGGVDSFVFMPGDGRDEITDFQAGTDILVLDPEMIEGSLAKFLSDQVRPIRDGFRIDFGDGDVLEVTGDDLNLTELAQSVLFG